jgi:hypothetical protein
MATTSQDNKPQIPFNEKSLEAFSKEGIEHPYELTIRQNHDRFRAKWKPEKGLQVIINSMIRQPRIIFDEKGNAVKKDYLTYYYDIIGKDCLENSVINFFFSNSLIHMYRSVMTP